VADLFCSELSTLAGYSNELLFAVVDFRTILLAGTDFGKGCVLTVAAATLRSLRNSACLFLFSAFPAACFCMFAA